MGVGSSDAMRGVLSEEWLAAMHKGNPPEAAMYANVY